MLRVVLVLLVLITFALVPRIQAQESLATINADTLNVRSGPGTGYDTLATLNRGASVVIEARTANADWLLIHTPDQHVRGWVATAYLTPAQPTDYMTFPESQEQISTAPATQPTQPANPAPEIPAGQIVGVTNGAVNLRAGVGRGNRVILQLAPQTSLILIGRNAQSTWLQVQLADGSQEGWVLTSLVTIQNGTVSELLVIEDMPAAASDASTSDDPGVLIASLKAVPTLYNFASGRLRSIYVSGKHRGNQAHVFTTIGDSQSINLPFLIGFGQGTYDLADYSYLQETIDFFSVSPREGIANSFVNTVSSQATYSGGNAYTLQDPTFANPALCQSGESPVTCEFRLVKPSIAIIMVGSMDVSYSTAEEYAANMGRLIQTCINNGVIPVLTTVPISDLHPEYIKILQFNVKLIALARQYNVPLINLWAAIEPLPNHGVRTLDQFHLSGEAGEAYYFGPQLFAYGTTVRNLLTLQALDRLRTNVLY